MNDYFQPTPHSRSDDATARGEVSNLSARTRAIFTQIVDLYLETGSPVGSKVISSQMEKALSPASIRAIMADLEAAGLLFQPHASAGRLPTETGLRLFVDGLLEVGSDIPKETRARIDVECNAYGVSFADALEQTTSALSGLSRCASLVITPKRDASIRHVEFVPLGRGVGGRSRALVVIVNSVGDVENRIIDLPADLPPSALVEAGNFLSTMLAGSTLAEADNILNSDIAARRMEIDTLSRKVIDAGLAHLVDSAAAAGTLILRGHANLLEDISAAEDIEKIRTLFSMLEIRENTRNVLEAVQKGSGVQIFIGAENALFGNTDCAMIIAPYKDSDQKVIGAVGVIGPRRMNYARIIPMVDYTGEAITKMLSL